MSKVRVVLTAMILAILGAGVLAGQSSRATVGDAAVEALVSEVRTLRADIARASHDTSRFQMLLSRIQMQEQRIAHLDSHRKSASAKVLEAVGQTEAVRERRRHGTGALD